MYQVPKNYYGSMKICGYTCSYLGFFYSTHLVNHFWEWAMNIIMNVVAWNQECVISCKGQSQRCSSCFFSGLSRACCST